MYCPRFLLRYTSTSRAGQAGGGSLKREKNYKPKKDFAYRIVLWQPWFIEPFSDDSNKVPDDAKSLPNCGRSQSATTCYSSYAPIKRQYYSILRSTTPHYKLLQKYYSVLQSTSTKKYYPSTVPYCSVLPSAAAVLFCTTGNHSNTTLHYNVLQRATAVLLQYYSVIQGTSPVLLRTTKYYEVLLRTTNYYKKLLRTTTGRKA